jgi:hypothetical protein
MAEVQIYEVSLAQHCWVSSVTSHTILADVTNNQNNCFIKVNENKLN